MLLFFRHPTDFAKFPKIIQLHAAVTLCLLNRFQSSQYERYLAHAETFETDISNPILILKTSHPSGSKLKRVSEKNTKRKSQSEVGSIIQGIGKECVTKHIFEQITIFVIFQGNNVGDYWKLGDERHWNQTYCIACISENKIHSTIFSETI